MTPPNAQLIKVNFDGARDKYGRVECSFILQSANKVITTEYNFYSDCSVPTTGFLACQDSLLCTRHLGVEDILLEEDSSVVNPFENETCLKILDITTGYYKSIGPIPIPTHSTYLSRSKCVCRSIS